MTELLLFALLACALLFTFLRILLHGPVEESEGSGDFQVLIQLVALPGLSFSRSDLLFDQTDYLFLRSNTELLDVAYEYWHERRRLALKWLALLASDVESLWRLRRFLARHGIAPSVGEELRVACSALTTLAAIHSLRVAVLIAGPFAFVNLLRSVHARLAAISHSCARLLSQIPLSEREELRRLCALEFAGSMPASGRL